MKYVTDHFTLKMISESTYTIKPKTLKKSKFKRCVKKAKSCINSKLIAHMLHKKAGKNRIELKKGDEIYLVTSEFGRKHSCDYTHNKELRFEMYTIV